MTVTLMKHSLDRARRICHLPVDEGFTRDGSIGCAAILLRVVVASQNVYTVWVVRWEPIKYKQMGMGSEVSVLYKASWFSRETLSPRQMG